MQSELRQELNVVDVGNIQVCIPMVDALKVGQSLGVANHKTLLVRDL